MVYDPDNRVSLAAIHAIGVLRSASGAEPLVAVACDPQSDVPRRRAATTALGNLHAGGAREALCRLLTSEHPAIRRAAASALRLQRDPACVPALKVASSDVDPTVREAVIVALADLAPRDAFEYVALRIDDSESTVRAGATSALHKFPYDLAAPRLEQACHDRAPEVRAAAARTIGLFRSDRLLGALEDLLGDRHRVVQRAVVVALARVQPRAVHDGVILAMGSPDAQLRETVASALGEIRHPDAEAMLRSLATDEDPGVREASREALSHRRSLEGAEP
jgi:HEAT repeat protein